MRFVLFCILILPIGAAADETFSFQGASGSREGYFIAPANAKAVILYFHRAIENREAVKEWASLLGPSGYGVAGYTAVRGADLADAAAAFKALRTKTKLPIVAMGASMGTSAAAHLFATEPSIRALIVIVPGDPAMCDVFAKSSKRPVFLIQAEKDDVVSPDAAAQIQKCFGPTGKYLSLKNTTHRFPPSQISDQIVAFLQLLPM